MALPEFRETAELFELPSAIEIRKFKPSEITLPMFLSLGLIDLIRRGYDRTENEISGAARAFGEFDEEDERSFIYLAIENKRAIGELVATIWSTEDKFGKWFWRNLERRNPSLAGRLKRFSPVGVNISGVTTDPDYRGKGLGKKLYQAMVSDLNPSFVTGATKEPAAVLARASALKDGFRTFYGNMEVTPGKNEITSRHMDLIDADIASRNRIYEYAQHWTGSDVYDIEGWLSQKSPRLAELPSHIKRAFENLREAQDTINNKGEEKTAIKILISVTNAIRLMKKDSPEEEAQDIEAESFQIPLGIFGEPSEPPQIPLLQQDQGN